MPTELRLKHQSVDGVLSTSYTLFNNIINAQSLSDNLFFDFDADNKTFVFHPIVNERVLHGNIRLFDDKNCYEDIEIYLNQDNGLWAYEGEYVERIVNSTCCINDKPQTIILDGINNGVQITCGSWIKNIKAFSYANDDLIINAKSNENGYILSITLDNCEVYDAPIYVCGYDKNGVLIAQIVFYLTVLFEQIEEENCFLSVSPSQIILTNEQYKNGKFDEFKFKYTAYNPNETKDLTVNDTTICSITADTPCISSYSISNYLNLGIYSGITTDKNIELTWKLGNCEDKTYIHVKKYINFDPHFYVAYGDIKNGIQLKDSSIFFKDEIDEIITTENTIDVPYKDAIDLAVDSSGSWIIYSYDSSKISCFKKDSNTLELQLVDYEEANNIEIILKNTDNIFYVIKYSVADGLVAEDEYEMYWCEDNTPLKENDKPIVNYAYGYYYTTLSGGDVPSLQLHSAYSLAIDDNEPQYGDWAFSSSRNISYEIKQYRNGNWVSLRSMTVGTKDLPKSSTSGITVIDSIFDVNIYVGQEPQSPIESDVWITTDQTFTVKTECYIDFFQVQGEASVRLNITHPPVVKYRVYTDQEGKVKINFN